MFQTAAAIKLLEENGDALWAANDKDLRAKLAKTESTISSFKTRIENIEAFIAIYDENEGNLDAIEEAIKPFGEFPGPELDK